MKIKKKKLNVIFVFILFIFVIIFGELFFFLSVTSMSQ